MPGFRTSSKTGHFWCKPGTGIALECNKGALVNFTWSLCFKNLTQRSETRHNASWIKYLIYPIFTANNNPLAQLINPAC